MRKCSFNPEEHLAISLDENNVPIKEANGEYRYNLPYKARMVWFYTWCAENNHVGRITSPEFVFQKLDDREGNTLCIATVDVYIDNELVGSDSATCILFSSGMYDKRIVTITASLAKGRALENAGFCIIENDPQKVPVEPTAPANEYPAVPGVVPSDEPYSPMSATRPATVETQPTSMPETKPAPAIHEAPVAATMTFDAAASFVWPNNNKFKGMTIAEMYATPDGQNAILSVAGRLAAKYMEKQPELVKVCQTYLNGI